MLTRLATGDLNPKVSLVKEAGMTALFPLADLALTS